MGEAIRTAVKTPEIKKEKQVSQVQKGNFCQPVSSPVEQILFLQRTIGNQAVQRLMKSGALQAKLRIGAPGDVYEQEADRVAEQVMRMLEPQAISRGIPYIQRACPKCENDELKRQPIKEEDEEEKLQRKQVEEEEEELQAKEASGGISEVNPDIESHIKSLKGGGKPLSENDRAFFESRFGVDFSDVRIHTAAPAAHLARAVDARAFTMGHDVFFGAGQYQMQTDQGKSLMAHELAHVIQQRGITRQIQRVYKPLLPPGDCIPAVHRALQDTVNQVCKVKRGCDQNDDCPAILQKIQANADCIKARVIINAKCFRGGDVPHILAVGAALVSLANCWLVYNRKCQVKTPPPLRVPVPEKNPKPVVDKGFMEKMAAITGLTGTALVIYLIVSEGSRLFPPRNLVPVP